MDTIAVPLSPDLRNALTTRLAPTLGHSRARREVARAAAGQPSPEVQAAVTELWTAPRAMAARLAEIAVTLLTEMSSLATATAPHLPEGVLRDEYLAHVGRLLNDGARALTEVAVAPDGVRPPAVEENA
ncbi:hypothetical protein B4N89_20640 [Embleya scabrispora]|uniref:Uncharacterized protein n=1 Tax=Embleya scabrispora TaxID=159449 RepID=A0A1T3P1P5_9ACTN|nr:hypothetical protein [Embleya scabrispora]OPC83023.1 hypothetical protein B4N89_20640 [Embleya scabrispora]